MRPSDEEVMAVIRAKPGLRMGEIMRELGIEETSANKGRMNKVIISLRKWRFIEPIDGIRPTRWKEFGTDAPQRERTLFDKCRERGLNYNTVIHRLRRGWGEEKALTTPITKKEKKVKE